MTKKYCDRCTADITHKPEHEIIIDRWQRKHMTGSGCVATTVQGGYITLHICDVCHRDLHKFFSYRSEFNSTKTNSHGARQEIAKIFGRGKINRKDVEKIAAPGGDK